MSGSEKLLVANRRRDNKGFDNFGLEVESDEELGESVRVDSAGTTVRENGKVIINVFQAGVLDASAQESGVETGHQPTGAPASETLDLLKDQQRKKSEKLTDVQSRSIGVGTTSDDDPDPEGPKSGKFENNNQKQIYVDEGTALRRRSLVPMSSMEEENLRERLRIGHLRLCQEVVGREQRYTRDGLRKLLQSKDLLEQIFKLFDQDRKQFLPQDNWIEFLKQRLINEHQIDFAEQLESVAFCLCGDEPIKSHQFYQIFNAKGVSDKLFRLLDENNLGIVSPEQIMEFLASITNSRPRTGIDQQNLARLEQLFRQTVGTEKEIKKDDFNKIVNSKNPFFTARVFQIFDKDDSGSISLQEFLDAMHQFAGQSPDDKIRFMFKVYDIDGDGLIQYRELQDVMRACMEENGMQFSDEQIEDLTVALFEDADTNSRGAITYEALKSQLEKHGGLLENLSISIDRWLVPAPLKPIKSTSRLRKVLSYRPNYLTVPYWKNNMVYLTFLFGFLLVNVALFISRSIQYRHSNWFTIFARACGQCLNFNCAFILVLMLRRCITFLRTRGYGSVLPLDQHIYFHKITGWLIFGYSFWHSIMHTCNFSLLVVNDPVLNERNFTTSQWLFTAKPGLFGLIGGWANPTGVALFVILLVMFLCSQSFVRRGGCFEVFYWTHLMYVPFWILLLLHGPNFWKWFIIPGVAYLIERISRVDTMSNKGKTYISSGLLLPSKVTHLVIKRPAQFDFHPGDYVFVNIPAIAKYEWHPFTISSCPEQEDYMWLHIRGVGQWTNRLYEYFEKEQEKLHSGEVSAVQSCGSTPKPSGNDSEASSTPNAFSQIKATITRTLSRTDKTSEGNKSPGPGVQLVGFSSEDHEGGGEGETLGGVPEMPNRGRRMSPEHRLQRLVFSKRAPLEKSLSLPDVQTNAKKRERMLALREYMRSESEKSFDPRQMRKARQKSLGLAYFSPQNKSLAQSFRYMRNKPTIIAFKTPSLENCDQRDSSRSFASTVGKPDSEFSYYSPERRVEEGQVFQLHDMTAADPKLKHINYPVGKPLETEDSLKNGDLKIKFLDQAGTEIFLDGPYGAPSSHIFRAQHAVLIATGIGVTPFASILQSIMHRYWKARHTCPKCKFSWACDIPATVMNLRKVDFFWINRNQRSFEWFVNLLSQLEIEQAELGGAMERFLEMHMYITSALQKTDMKAVGLQLALDLLHEKEKRDLITGLKTRTNAGRPNWDKVFKQISDQKKGKVTVFYCGPPQLGRILRVKCDQYGFIFRKESF
ncbi:NADPH oxidase 5 [Anthonomus grandis grandis]|uniref:NADPH oxidase 5 n=1 Tax=Anthonomus grandis grandis TaxID=2921223 RepID=UPI0021669D4B|nr:NADPH oxidase 5 [Anthonomus grandis grandis]